VTPLRGLGWFAESERDVFFGREREREELAKLVTSDGYRAGLLYGEAGVGKRSLLHAGLQPDLRDYGVVALLCADNTRPLDSFAHALSQGSGQSPEPGESATGFLARIISQDSQMYIFILDGIDIAMQGDERITTEVAELFMRVASRSAGRARFLFSCSSERVHRFAALEQRTGSLFPPSSRYELKRLLAPQALMVLERTIALAGIPCEDAVAPWLVQHLAERGPILPADLQIAALSLKEQNITTVAALQALGGYAELERRWLGAAAAATGNERSAMRLLGELATNAPGAHQSAQDVAGAAGVPVSFASSALITLQGQGLVHAYPVLGSEELSYSLSHEILGVRVREVAAPAKRAAERAIELLGNKATQSKRLTAKEYMTLRREGIVPSTPQQKAVIARTELLGKVALGAVCALPFLITLIAYLSMSGNYYLDTSNGNEGVETIVVRAGKPSLSWFNWLPKSPSFGSIVADTGLSKRMVSEKLWSQAQSHDASGSLEGSEYVKQTYGEMRPRLALLLDYATNGEAATLDALQQGVTDAADFAELLSQLRPIAQGSAEEEVLVKAALAQSSAVAQTEALNVAATAAGRRAGSYEGVLTEALSAPEAGRRRLAISVVRTLPSDIANGLFQKALARDPEATARRELLALVSANADASAPSAASATGVLLGEDVSKATRRKARALLERAFEGNPAAATADAARLIASASAESSDRVLAMALTLDYAPESGSAGVLPAVATALKSQDVNVRAAALPLYAHLDPDKAAGDLATMLTQEDLAPEMQVALALGWGEVARANTATKTAAQSALEQLLKSQRRDVRAAAARAYGYLGRPAQEALIKMVKTEFIDVAESAAYGLANSIEVGASVGNALGGIRDMWKRKGRLRRIAANVFVRIARTKPGPVYPLLVTAARSTDDDALQPIGMRGLCNALKAGHTKVGRDLAMAANNSQIDVRRIAIECVVDYPKNAAVAARVAAAMVDDSSGDIRAESARVLGSLAAGGKSPELVGSALSKMVKDENRGVRMIAILALASLPDGAPTEALEALPFAFDHGDEGEKLAVLNVASKIGATEIIPLGIADPSPLVRIQALKVALSTNTDVGAALSSSLTDPTTSVRRAALEQLTMGTSNVPPADVDKALALAIRDSDPGISALAMMASARHGDPSQVAERLSYSLASRSEAIRVKATTASLGLVTHDPVAGLALLEPLLLDSSHDVRVALLRPLATSYAGTLEVNAIVKLLGDSEDRANRRLAAAAALWLLSGSADTREAATTGLQSIAKDGPPLAQQSAALVLSLRANKAAGMEFLTLLVP